MFDLEKRLSWRVGAPRVAGCLILALVLGAGLPADTANAIPAPPRPVVIIVPTSDTKPMEDNYREGRTARLSTDESALSTTTGDERQARLRRFIRSLFLRSLFTFLPR